VIGTRTVVGRRGDRALIFVTDSGRGVNLDPTGGEDSGPIGCKISNL
jgi:hypothetical protein